MNCNETIALIAAHTDGELDPVQATAFEKHRLGCPDCAARSKAADELRQRIRREAPYHVAPQALRARVIAALPTKTATGNAASRSDRWRWLGTGALAGALATVVAWVVGTSVITVGADDRLENELIASHIRATLSHRLIDVASSDQHTVKPWLSARLDYSPSVEDLGESGFPLVGARLEYLDKQGVATLVYRYRDHTIDVFVRPQSRSVPATAPRTIRGFHVAHSVGGAMDWWAVSDASLDVLVPFVTRLANDASR